MPIESLFNLNLLRAHAAGAFSEEALAPVESLNRIFLQALLATPLHPDGESRSEEVLRRLEVAADELRGLGSWLASHAFPHVELLAEETEDDQLYAYREEHGRQLGEFLLVLVARFQESFHPTAEELRAWRERLPERVPYWNLGEPLEYPPPVRPPAREGDELILSTVAEDLARLGEFLRQAVRHYSWMLEDLPEPGPEADGEEGDRQPLAGLAAELESLRRRLGLLARDVTRISAERRIQAEQEGR